MSEVHDPRFDPEPHYETLEEEDRRGGRGCLFWGCLITGIGFLMLLIGVPLGIYFAAKHYVQKFTTEEPAVIEVVELPEERLLELNARIEAFTDAVEEDAPPADLELTADEINALINQNEDLRGRAFVRVDDGQVGGDISIPADRFPGGGGRFFNATVDFDVSMEGGRLVVVLTGATVNGTSIPQEVLDQLANENLAKDVADDEDIAKVLKKFDSIEIVGDRILLKAKEPAPDKEAVPAVTDEPAEAEPEAEAAEPVEAP